MSASLPSQTRARHLTLALIPFASFAFYISLSPFAGDPCYHNFADARPLGGIPNFADVMSNLPFLIVGLIGLTRWLKHRPQEAPLSWLTFHLGVIGVALGSAYYHWNPSDATLVWDRLPMTLGFIGLSLALMAEMVHPAFDRHPLLPALLIGIGSVFYWYNMHDLRPYLWVQTLPLLIIPTTTIVFPRTHSHHAYLIYALAFYIAAKIAENGDRKIWGLLGETVSGHTIKHLLAAAACAMIVLMLHRREACTDEARVGLSDARACG